MSGISVTTSYLAGGTLLPNTFIDQYMVKANGEYVKVYVYLLHLVTQGQSFSISCLADLLELTERDILRALNYWEKEGLITMSKSGETIISIDLLPISNQKAPVSVPVQEEHSSTEATPPAKILPALRTLSPIQIQEKNNDKTFSFLLYIAETYIGKPLNHNDINILCYFYDDLSMSSELIEYLIDYCVSNGKKSFRYMQSVALAWYEKGITDVESAKSDSSSYRKDYYKVMHAFGLNTNPAPAQLEYLKCWLDTEHFELELVIEACNRTIDSINKASFKYANSILKRWKDNQVHTLNDVKTFESKHKPTQTKKNQGNNQFHNFTQRDYDFDDLEKRYIQKINHDVKEG
ncbi:MAG: DnaD domain protein [Anaerostipes sp.]|nr:DnaD domain protein [Anaerostipes sp.]